MSYHFTQGRYRAFIETTYTDSSGVYQTVDGPAVEFDADPIEYFEFETNPSIKINLSTMEAPNAELVSEGNYKGINYKLYNNSLAILQGTQSSDITSSDTTPWVENYYIYASIVIRSGYVFKSDNYKELQVRNSSFKAGGATSAYLFSNTGYDCELINIEELDTSNLTDFSRMFCNLRVGSLLGLHRLDFTNGNNFDHFASGLCCTPGQYSYGNNFTWEFDTAAIDPTGTNHKFDYAFDFSMNVSYSGSGRIDIYLTALNNPTMFRHEDGVMQGGGSGHYLYIDVSQTLPVNCSHIFDGNDANWITLIATAPANCNMSYMFANCSRLRYAQLGNNMASSVTTPATNMTGMFKNCTSLYEPRNLDMSNCIYADEMYRNCQTLGYESSSYGSATFNAGGPMLISAIRMFYDAMQDFGSRATNMSLSLSVSMTGNVNLQELLTGAGIGYRGGFDLYISGSGSQSANKAIHMHNAFTGIRASYINFYVNRGGTGDNYLFNVSLEDIAVDSVLQTINMRNLFITDADNAFKNCRSLNRLTFFEDDFGVVKSYCKFANNASTNDMLYGCSELTTMDAPNNLYDKGTGVSIALPVSMRPYDYQTQTWGAATMTATQSLAGYSTYMGD